MSSYQALAVAVLADWYEVERTLRDVPSESLEATFLLTEARHLHAEYERLVEAAVLFHLDVPPPFPSLAPDLITAGPSVNVSQAGI